MNDYHFPCNYDITKPLDKQGLQMCDHCSGYGSSLKDPEGVDRCTKCGGTGVMPLTCSNCGGIWNPKTKKIEHHPVC